MASQRKVPLRKCAATNEMFPKKEMIRIVRTKEGEVFVDPTGKKSGRGTYVSKSEEAVALARQNKGIEKQLQVPIEESIYEELIYLIKREQLV
ncbi:MAG TPA: YlxR family protein [Savagea sp.]